MVKQSAQTNGIEPDKTRSYVGRIENVEGEIESLKGEFMSKVKAKREDIKQILEDAKNEGIPKKSLKAVIAVRKLERKIEKAADGLDIDEAAGYEQMMEALGELADTPLGGAAMAAAGADAAAAPA